MGLRGSIDFRPGGVVVMMIGGRGLGGDHWRNRLWRICVLDHLGLELVVRRDARVVDWPKQIVPLLVGCLVGWLLFSSDE